MKFRNLSASVLSQARQQRTIEVALNLRDRSITELLSACAPAS
jgi:hypothetical protein